MCVYDAADGNIRIWKDYNVKNKQKRVTAFSSIQGHKPGVRSLNAVVDWQQQSGYLVHIFLKKSTSSGPSYSSCVLGLCFMAKCKILSLVCFWRDIIHYAMGSG
jgi:hypothetical protein